MILKEKIEKNKLYKFFIVLLSIVLIIVIFAKQENQEKFLGLFNRDDISNVNIDKKKTINLENIKDAINYEECIVVHKENQLVGYGYDGKEQWSKDIVLKNYNLFFGESNIYIYEKPTGYIQFINKSGDIFKEMNLDEEIKGLKKDYENIIVYTEKDSNEKIYIIDKNTNIREVNDLELKNILTYSASKEYASYGISTLNLDAKDMNSKFTAFKYGNQVLYRKDFNGEMVLYSKFLDTHRVVIMTDKNVYLLNDFEGNTLWKKSYELIKDIDVKDNKINILYGNTLETLAANGHIDSKYSFVDNYRKIVTFDNFIMVYGDNNIMAIRDGEELFKEEVKNKLIKIQPGKEKFIIIYEDKIDVYNILD